MVRLCPQYPQTSLQLNANHVRVRANFGSDLATRIAVVSSESEAEVGGAVHAHHHMRNWHEDRCSLAQGHPQFLTGLIGQRC